MEYQPQINVHGQQGQGNWLITLCAAFAVTYTGWKNPQNLPLYQEFKDVATYVQSIKPLDKCTMQALSRTPPIGCETTLK